MDRFDAGLRVLLTVVCCCDRVRMTGGMQSVALQFALSGKAVRVQQAKATVVGALPALECGMWIIVDTRRENAVHPARLLFIAV